MKQEIEQILLDFEKAIKSNPELRIESFEAVSKILNSITPADREELIRELILLETDYRYEARQPLEVSEYEKRFPEYIKHVDDAFKLLDRKIIEEQDFSDFELINVTQKYSGSYFVNPINSTGKDKSIKLPSELGKYSEIKKVGQGGFGVVCRALDSEVNEYRALKFPKGLFSRNDEYLAAVREETEKSIGLDHPYVVRTFGMDVIEPFAFVVQEFVDGGNLSQWMKQDHSIRQKVEMMVRIARGLHYAHAHEKEITHCDIKPANILVDSNGNPKITDFGLSFHEKDRLGLPLDGWGTPAYVAPEILEGYFRFSDGRADIFSLGVMFYEMLAGRRPFVHVESKLLVEEIKFKTPKSIRLLNPEVDAELERICFRCLQKKTLDRYQLASDLELELREWLAEPVSSTEKQQRPQRFVPRGLRSFKAEDAAFFQELLPGVRDQGNVPISLTFWSKRICEPVPEEDRIPNGFLFGPSGSGKSSFVKAGLIPLVQQQVETIYVEANNNDTEVRILKSLRRRFPDIPKTRSLPEVFAGLSNGKWRDGAKPGKVLLILDQFEQWITRGEQYDQTQLVHGLRHCDGENLQSLMLVRDDFIFGCSRFADALDINLAENDNYKDVDLFDESHAKTILIKYGQAYQKLPPEELMSDEQHQFVNETIKQLEKNHYVVCVRLTLFAEMFKDREWTIEELNSVGGVAGVGEQFLESKFGADSSNTLYRANRKKVQAILEKLLPESGRDIRGAMKSSEELMIAAQCENNKRSFEDITKILHDQLKLITRTDPDASGDTTVNENISPDGKVYYQLTHDYLVPSIRDWLNTQNKNTAGGRALIRMRELASQVVPGQKPKYLPSNVEWLYWGLVLRSPTYSENEQAILRATRYRFLRQAGIMAIGLVLIIAAYASWSRYSKSHELARQILERPYASLPEVIEASQAYKGSVKSYLDRAVEQKGSDKESQLRVSLAASSADEDSLDTIVDGITDPLTNATKLRAITEIIAQGGFPQPVIEKLLPSLNDVGLDPERRFRAALAIVTMDKTRVQWKEYSGWISQVLCAQSSREIDGWINLAEGIGNDLLVDLEGIFRESIDAKMLSNSAEALYLYQTPERAWDLFYQILQDSNAVQFEVILELAESRQGKAILKQKIDSLGLTQSGNRTRATVAIALARLGYPETLLSLLTGTTSRTARNYAIVFANEKRIPVHQIIPLLETQLAKSNPLVRQAVLLMVANQVPAIADTSLLDRIQTIAREGYLDTSFASCFAANEAILRRLNDGPKQIDELRSQRYKNLVDQDGIKGEIFINSLGIPFTIINVRNGSDGPLELAVSMHEVANRDVAEVFPKLREVKNYGGDLKPFQIQNVSAVVQFCIELSDREMRENVFSSMIGKSERFLFEMPIKKQANGYRVLTESERKQIHEMNHFDFGKDNELASYFCQIYQNTEGEIADCGQLFPNEKGLFDVFGNCQELTLSVEGEHFGKSYRFGSTNRSNASEIQTDSYELFQIRGSPDLGFRLVRIIKM